MIECGHCREQIPRTRWVLKFSSGRMGPDLGSATCPCGRDNLLRGWQIRSIEEAQRADPPAILHLPPEPGSESDYTPCCFIPVKLTGALCTSDPSRVTCPGAAPMSRESLHARVFDLIRRSGVGDGERLIQAMQADAAEIAECLGLGCYYASLAYETDPLSLRGRDALRESYRIDRAIAGKEIGAPKPASEKP